MRSILPERLEAGRITTGLGASRRDFGPYGAFKVYGPCGADLMIVASGADYPDAHGWEHVSISTPRRPPNWQEMCFVKDLFWSDEECVIQFHPPKSEYVNNHPHCLHLWRNINQPFPLPPSILVGLKDRGLLSEDEAYALRKIQFGAA